MIDLRLSQRLPSVFRRLRRRRLPYVAQTTASDCGAACLTSLIRHHGRFVRLEEVRDRSGTDRDGTTAQSILDAARQYGLRGRGVSLDLDELHHLRQGAILHWRFEHFIMFERCVQGGVEVMDPATGRRVVSNADFERDFTGVALLIEPTAGFTRGSERPTRTWEYLRALLAHGSLFARIVGASVLVQAFGLGLPLLTGLLVDRVVPRGDVELLGLLSTGFVLLVASQFLASLVRSHLLLELRTRLDARLTLDFLEHMVSLPYAFFQRRSAGDLMMRMNSNSTVREVLTSGALSGALDGLLVVTYLIVLLWVSLPIALMVSALAGLRLIVFLVSRRRIGELMSEGLSRQADSQSYQVQLLSGIETLKASGTEHYAVEHWSGLFADVLNANLARGRLNALVQAVIAGLGFASPLVILTVGALLVLNGSMTLGTMLALSALAGGFLIPFTALIQTAVQFRELGSYLDRIEDVLQAEPEQREDAVRPAPTLKGHVSLEAVTFRYGPDAPPAVRNVSIEIQPGQLVAFVGRSAAGKSTLAALLMALHRPQHGRILYDGLDLAELEVRSVRRQIGVVMQHQHLFGLSIRRNIALADPEAPLEKIERAARLACIHDEIDALPMGYNTMLVDGGLSLSGGQRQRLILARALMGEPSILVLDEATSALDAATERRVQGSLAGLACTRIVIAHRLSTVREADRIFVLDQGEVVADGTHDQLLVQAGIYRELVAGQALTS